MLPNEMRALMAIFGRRNRQSQIVRDNRSSLIARKNEFVDQGTRDGRIEALRHHVAHQVVGRTFPTILPRLLWTSLRALRANFTDGMQIDQIQRLKGFPCINTLLAHAPR
jgi:hypothetical protein